MAMTMFGFEIRRKVESENQNVGLEPRTQDDGAVVVAASGGMYGTAIDLDGSIRNDQAPKDTGRVSPLVNHR